jgi:hypothetical protein
MLDPENAAPRPSDAPHGPADGDLGETGTLVVEDHGFAIVGDWVINDAAFRVYSLLLRFGGSSGNRMPSRGLLARRLHRSVDSIDRALRELVDQHLVRVKHRHAGRKTLSNRYHVRTSPPATEATPAGGRISAASTASSRNRGRKSAAPCTSAAPPAAGLRPN